MNVERPVLNRSMMERYEIETHRPAELRAVLFGAEEIMLGGVARVLDSAGIGALCVTERSDVLLEQDGMFTVLVRSDACEKAEERVVQSVLCAVNPEKDFDEMLLYTQRDGIDSIFCCAEASAVQLALMARFIFQLHANGKTLPAVYCVSDLPKKNCAEHMRKVLQTIAAGWGSHELWERIEIYPVLCDGLFGVLSEREAERQQDMMNYTDYLLMWAQPEIRLLSNDTDAAFISPVQDMGKEIDLAAKTDHALEFFCAAGGFLTGKDSFSEVLKDDNLRKWIAHAWFDELLPEHREIPAVRERIIRAFERYEDASNHVKLLSAHNLMQRFTDTLLPAIRSYAAHEFEVPRLSVLAFSAAVMVYAGITREEDKWLVCRGEESAQLIDEADILEAFENLSHDMPAESLAYAVLADRTVWGEDLREIDGLEMAVVSDLSSIQRIGFVQTMMNHIKDL